MTGALAPPAALIHAGAMFWWYPQVEYPLAATQLILAMAGMGANLTPAEFRAIVRQPQSIGFVLLVQYLVLPAAAALAAYLAGLPAGIALGLVLVNAISSGAFTTVFTLLGHGNVSLAIVAMCASTALCFVATPLAIDWLSMVELPGDVRIPFSKTVVPVFAFLLLPMFVGMLIGQAIKKRKHAFAKWAVRASLIPLSVIVIGSLGSGRIDVTEYGWRIPILIVLFIYAAMVLTRRFAMLIGYNWSDAFTIGIVASLRNGNLGIALAASLFPATSQEDPIGRGVFFVTLFSAGAMTVIGLLSVAQRRILLSRETRQAVAM